MWRSRIRAGVAVLLAPPALASCGGGHRLADYDFAGRALAVTHFPAPAPVLRSDGYDLRDQEDDALLAVIHAGSRVAREVEARRARARLDSAAALVDITDRVARRAVERASRYLGAYPVESSRDADYLLEVDIHSLGIDARSNQAYLFVSGEAILVDTRTGFEIWQSEVRRYDPLTPVIRGGRDSPVPTDIITAGALGTVSVADLRQVIERLADHAADVMVDDLRHDLRSVRR